MTKEELIVEKIILDLKDRKGLRQEWEQIDNDVKEEICSTWAELIKHGCKGSEK